MRTPSLVLGLLATLISLPVIAKAPLRFPPGAVWQQDVSRGQAASTLGIDDLDTGRAGWFR